MSQTTPRGTTPNQSASARRTRDRHDPAAVFYQALVRGIVPASLLPDSPDVHPFVD